MIDTPKKWFSVAFHGLTKEKRDELIDMKCAQVMGHSNVFAERDELKARIAELEAQLTAPVAPDQKSAMMEIALRAVQQHLERDEYTEAGIVVQQALAMVDQPAHGERKPDPAQFPHKGCKTPSECRRDGICADGWHCATTDYA